MSGKKKAYVSISREEYHRLQNATDELKQHKRAAKHSARSQRKTHRNITQQYHQLEHRQTDFMRAVSSLQDELYEIEELTSQQILAHKADLLHDVDQIAEHHTADVHTFFETKRADLLHELSTIQAARERALTAVMTEIEGYQRDDHRKQRLAAEWINTTANLLDHLEVCYHPLPQTASLLADFEHRLLLAKQNHRDRLPEAALVAAQNIYIELTRARVELEQYLQAQELQRHNAREYVEQLQDTLQANAICPAIDLEGQPTAAHIEVNSWTQGELDQLAAQLDEWLHAIPDLNLADLTQLIDQELPAAEQALHRTVQRAKLSALDAQLRINIADLVIQALHKQDYQLQSSHYLHENAHNGYYAQAVNREGSEVQILVNPVGHAIGDNELFLDLSSRDQISENEYHVQAAEITQTLTQFGLQAAKLSSVSASEFYRPFQTTQRTRQHSQHVR